MLGLSWNGMDGFGGLRLDLQQVQDLQECSDLRNYKVRPVCVVKGRFQRQREEVEGRSREVAEVNREFRNQIGLARTAATHAAQGRTRK